MIKHSFIVSPDLLLLLGLIPTHMQLQSETASFLLVLPFFFYIVLELGHSLIPYAALPENFGRTRLFFLLRLFLLLIIIAGATILPSLTNIYTRLVTPVDATGYSSAYANVHDGAVQMELALAFLNDGKNPYVESYQDTPLEYYGFTGIDLPINPAVNHFVYLPGFFVLSFPIYKMFSFTSFAYDQRWVCLLAYIILILLLPSLVNSPVYKLTLLVAVGLNPLLTWPVSIGMNDIIILLAIVLALVFSSYSQFVLAAIIFGFACTLKQSAWFVAPFFVLSLYQLLPTETRIRQTIKYCGIIALLMIVIIGPFALWDFSSFITDVWLYPSGSVAVNYPIRGYTIGNLLVGSGIIESSLDTFPFWILQLVVGLPLLWLLLRQQWKHDGLGTMLICAGVFIFGVGVVSRFFQDNYVGFVAVLILLGALLNADAERLLINKESG